MLNTSKLTVLQPIQLWVGIVFVHLFLTSNCPCVWATNTQWLYCGSINSASHATAIKVQYSELCANEITSPMKFQISYSFLLLIAIIYMAIYKCHLLAKSTVGREKETKIWLRATGPVEWGAKTELKYERNHTYGNSYRGASVSREDATNVTETVCTLLWSM